MASSQTILSVIGPCSGCGKTLFVTHLLRHIERLGCLKISPAYDWPEDSGGGQVVGEDFYLENSAHLNRPGKDTAVYLAAGATGVQRLRHRRNGLAAGLAAALKCFPPDIPIVVESSSAVRLTEPVAVVLVVRPPHHKMKATTRDVLHLVTDLLINALDVEDSAAAEAKRLGTEYPVLQPQYAFSADLISEPPPDKMLTRLRALLTRNCANHQPT
ncbi:MAG: hypothetical protein JSU86_11645 [Phycisphaerales bacterium]|nr:MAG: hypothetical protein JSU86_11645 [Phycisphaerales bacterium]